MKICELTAFQNLDRGYEWICSIRASVNIYITVYISLYIGVVIQSIQDAMSSSRLKSNQNPDPRGRVNSYNAFHHDILYLSHEIHRHHRIKEAAPAPLDHRHLPLPAPKELLLPCLRTVSIHLKATEPSDRRLSPHTLLQICSFLLLRPSFSAPPLLVRIGIRLLHLSHIRPHGRFLHGGSRRWRGGGRLVCYAAYTTVFAVEGRLGCSRSEGGFDRAG